MKEKIIIESKFMREALAEAELAFNEGEVPVGAVVEHGGEIIARAHNLVEAGKDPSAHAEMLALRRAAGSLGRKWLDDCRLYVTLEPCPMCMGAILNFRVGAVCFGAYDPEAGCAISRCELGSGLLNSSFPCVGGMLEEECAAILSRFFGKMRVKPTESGEEPKTV